MKWIYAALVVAIGLALHLGISLFLTPLVGAVYVVEPGHSMMLRALRVAAVALPALVLFAAAGLTRPGVSGRVVAMAVSLFLMGTRITKQDDGVLFTLDLRFWAVGSVVLLAALL